MKIIAAAQPTQAEHANLTVTGLLAAIGPMGIMVLLAVGALLLLRTKTGRTFAKDALSRTTKTVIRFVRISLWAASKRMPIRLAFRLQPERWREMCAARKLQGLKRGKVKRTPMGVDVLVTLGGALTLETLTARIKDLETGLGTRRGAIRVEGRESAHKATIRITVRNPLAQVVRWTAPTGLVSITEPARLSMNAFGEWTEVDLQQRILIVGASGSGKSSVQRVLSAPVILAADADLEVWDLKQGTESQHYEGKADLRITTPEAAKKRLDWFMDVELPRRAGVMHKLGTSTWPTSPHHPDRVVMVDEGAALIRALTDEELQRFFTFLEQARAFGIYLWWATQFPKGTNLPTELRSQMSAMIALKMRRMSESRVVFEDLTKEGWTPHRLPGKGWLMLLDDDHQDPEESRAAWIDEKAFRAIRPYATHRPAPAAPVVPPMPQHPPVIPAQAEAEADAAMDEAVTLTKTAAPEPVGELPVTDAIVAALSVAPSAGLSVAELQAATARGKSQVYAGLQELTDDGRAVKVGRGRYALDAGTEATA